MAEDPAQKRIDRDDFARDRARIVHSASLRRLSTKTQVWQPSADDFVRNRLTHTLEVAQIGRELANALGCNSDVVDAACLAHDLGHPPFGHFGEGVLNELADGYGGFEGNAQTFRLLTRLEPKRSRTDGRSVGLNLTRATLDAATKYPWRRGQAPRETVKFGVYEDDVEIFDFVREGASEGTCLEAQVMDWSDDVAYSVHDVEDGIAAHALSLKALRGASERAHVIENAAARYARGLEPALLEAAYDQLVLNDLPKSFDGGRRSLAGLKDMTSTLIGRFAAAAEDATRDKYGPGDLVRYEAKVEVPDEITAQVAILKGMAAHFIMFTSRRDVVQRHQREVIEGLVDHFTRHPEELDVIFAEDRAAATDTASAKRVIIDQVASLTDARALALFAEIQHPPLF